MNFNNREKRKKLGEKKQVDSSPESGSEVLKPTVDRIKKSEDEVPGRKAEKKREANTSEVFFRMIEKITAEFGELPELPVKRKAGKASLTGPAQRPAAGNERQPRSRKEEKAGTISSGRKGASNREITIPCYITRWPTIGITDVPGLPETCGPLTPDRENRLVCLNHD